ncbi:MAG: hypothetical protein MRY21_05830 [Simkaniaceae bacterium]|nr:hypothetical protein [Simkaniaceae bacterium]
MYPVLDLDKPLGVNIWLPKTPCQKYTVVSTLAFGFLAITAVAISALDTYTEWCGHGN